jgi:hypothetical protein
MELGKKHLFRDVSSTNIVTLVPSLYQCFESHSIEVILTVVSAISAAPFQHLHQRNIFHLSRHSWEPLYATNTSTVNRKHFFMNILCFESSCTQNRTTKRWSSVVHPQVRSPFWLLKPAFDHVNARLLPRLSWNWTVLLPSDRYKKPIMYITAVLLPFVTYLLTLSYIIPAVVCGDWRK